jgi:hypothetical protein
VAPATGYKQNHELLAGQGRCGREVPVLPGQGFVREARALRALHAAGGMSSWGLRTGSPDAEATDHDT